MSEFEHWYTKEAYEALERNKNAEIYRLKEKLTAIKDMVNDIEPVRNQLGRLQTIQQNRLAMEQAGPYHHRTALYTWQKQAQRNMFDVISWPPLF